MISSLSRGHQIICIDGQWLYANTRTPTAGHPRPCGHCDKPDTVEGHDGCLGTLPGVMNACCGHGDDDNAYVQFSPGRAIYGKEAVVKIAELRETGGI